MLTRQLQTAANDLAAVEYALMVIRESLSPRSVAKPAPPMVKKEEPQLWCSEFSRSTDRACCARPTHPHSLCPMHFRELFGHLFPADRYGPGGYGQGGRVCECGQVKVPYINEVRRKAQNREFCPLNGKSARAEEIKKAGRSLTPGKVAAFNAWKPEAR